MIKAKIEFTISAKEDIDLNNYKDQISKMMKAHIDEALLVQDLYSPSVIFDSTKRGCSVSEGIQINSVVNTDLEELNKYALPKGTPRKVAGNYRRL